MSIEVISYGLIAVLSAIQVIFSLLALRDERRIRWRMHEEYLKREGIDSSEE